MIPPAALVRRLNVHLGAGNGRVTVIRDLSLAIATGSLVLVVGPSGCGKTTLVSAFAGLITPTSGCVEVLGQDLSAMPERERASFRSRSIGFVFQAHQLLPTLSAAENVAVPASLQGVPRAEAVAAARLMLASFGLAHVSDRYPGQLSGGEQQRVAVARALVNAPPLVICDEPTAALDGRSGAQVLEVLREHVVGRGGTAIVVTHDGRIRRFADRIVEIDDGRIVADDTLQPEAGG